MAFLRLLDPAGAQTTYRALSNLLFGLLTHQDQLDAVRADRSLIPQAVEESLRWEVPLTMVFRSATGDAVIAVMNRTCKDRIPGADIMSPMEAGSDGFLWVGNEEREMGTINLPLAANHQGELRQVTSMPLLIDIQFNKSERVGPWKVFLMGDGANVQAEVIQDHFQVVVADTAFQDHSKGRALALGLKGDDGHPCLHQSLVDPLVAQESRTPDIPPWN